MRRIAAGDVQIPEVALRMMRVDRIGDAQRAANGAAQRVEHRRRMADHLPHAGFRLARRAPKRRRLDAPGRQPHAGRPVGIEQQGEQPRQPPGAIGGIGKDEAHRRIVGKGTRERCGDRRTIARRGDADFRQGLGPGHAPMMARLIARDQPSRIRNGRRVTHARPVAIPCENQAASPAFSFLA